MDSDDASTDDNYRVLLTKMNHCFLTFQNYQLEGCSDGQFNGRRYFSCHPKKGLFCLLRNLQFDQRYHVPSLAPAAAKRPEQKNR